MRHGPGGIAAARSIAMSLVATQSGSAWRRERPPAAMSIAVASTPSSTPPPGAHSAGVTSTETRLASTSKTGRAPRSLK